MQQVCAISILIACMSMAKRIQPRRPATSWRHCEQGGSRQTMLVCTAFLRFSRQLRCGRGQQMPPSPIILMPYRTNALHTDGFLGRAGGFRQMHLFYMAFIQMQYIEYKYIWNAGSLLAGSDRRIHRRRAQSNENQRVILASGVLISMVITAAVMTSFHANSIAECMSCQTNLYGFFAST